jgi:tetratricopeptide (TPR) repeat protein
MPEKTNLGIEHYRKVIELANKAGLRSREAKVLNQLGFYLFLNVDFKKGFEYLLRSDKLMQSVGYHNIEKVSFHLYNIAFAYSEFKNYTRSIFYFEKALEYSNNDSIVIMKLYKNERKRIKIMEKLYGKSGFHCFFCVSTKKFISHKYHDRS